MLTFDASTPIYGNRSRNQTCLLIFATVTTFASLFYWEGHIAENLFSDEGFFWYGVQRVMHGEVPTRDFMAYDPGRYYWTAAIISILGDDSIISIRFASALFQSVGLFSALWVITPVDARRNALHIMLSAIILSLWMFPSYKCFDTTVSIVLIASFAYLADQPTCNRAFVAGLVLGIVAWFGKNHGVYGAVGALFLFAYLSATHRNFSFIKSCASWSAGIVVGYLPMILMLIFISGFGIAFWEKSVRSLFELRATNLPLDIPWPWVVDFSQHWIDACRDFLIGSIFILLLLYGAFGLANLVRSALRAQRLPPPFVASVVLALPYAHYAFSRADIYHLAQGIFPLLIGLLAILSQSANRISSRGMALLVSATFWTILPPHPGLLAQRAGNWPTIKIGSSNLIVDPGTAGAMESVRQLVDAYATNGRDFFVAPFWPGAYAAFGRKSPVWEIYALFPRSREFQETEIERIKKTKLGFVLIYDAALDYREENHYRNTHPIVDQFVRNEYRPLDVAGPNNPLRIYIPKQNGL